MEEYISSKKITVTTAATAINLALGVLYTWSIFKEEIASSIATQGDFKWDFVSLNDPYAVCCLVLSCSLLVAGKCQRHFGSQRTAILGGVLVGLGFLTISQTTSYWGWIFGFGILLGLGIAFGYAAATPAALRWYPPHKSGKIAGLAVSAFALAGVYLAPLAHYVVATWGLQRAMLYFGFTFFVAVSCLAIFLVRPPAGYAPKNFPDRRSPSQGNLVQRFQFKDATLTPGQLLKSSSFWTLWLLSAIGSGAGLMVIGNLTEMAKYSLGSNAFVAVAILALGNAAGGVTISILSDKIDRRNTLALVFAAQALLLFLAIPAPSSPNAAALLLLALLIGFTYGATLALFPSFAKDYWGVKYLTVNYGLLFTSWGIGGFVMSRASQFLAIQTSSFTSSLLIAAVLLAFSAAVSFSLKATKATARRKINRGKLAASTQ